MERGKSEEVAELGQVGMTEVLRGSCRQDSLDERLQGRSSVEMISNEDSVERGEEGDTPRS